MPAFHDIAPALAGLFRAVLQASWQGALAIVLVLILRRALGRKVPVRWHYLLWLLVLARLLVPERALPRNPASLENLPVLAPPFVEPVEVTPGAIVPVPSVPDSTVDVALSAATVTKVTPAVPWAIRAKRSWQEWAAWVWLGGALGMTSWLAACVVGLQRKVRRETFPVDEKILALWRSCCQRWLRRASPDLRGAEWIDSPCVVGWWRPTLLLSRQEPDNFTAEDWEHVFAHEIAHLRWYDHWTQWLLLAVQCVHWFNPVVWLGLRRLRADRELAADEWVLRHLERERTLAYGETLFKTLASRPARSASQPGLVGISEDGAQMKRRLQRITAFLPGPRVFGSLLGFAVVSGSSVVVLGRGSSISTLATMPVKVAVPFTPPTVSKAAEAEKFSAALLAAARANDAAEVTRLIDSSARQRPATFSAATATTLLDDLVRRRELSAFTRLHDGLKQSSYGRNWVPGDVLLTGLIKEGRTDFLDALFARRLNPNRLKTLTATADAPTAAWITRRTAEVTRQRADLEALEKASANNDLAAMARLVEGGAEVNGVGQDENTPLLRAVAGDRLDSARWLLEHGAQVDKPRLAGEDYTPLCLAGSVPMAELLRAHGANVHAKLWRRDVSILFYVAKSGKPEMVGWFLQQGLDPKMSGDNHQNLLFYVAYARSAELLLNAGTDPNQVDQSGLTPICTARNAGVAQALLAHGAKVEGFKEPLLPRMVRLGASEAVDVVLGAQGQAADHDLIQRTLLDVAFLDKADVARVLLKHGANPNEPVVWHQSEEAETLPLFACTINPSAKTAQVLIEAGADPNAGEHAGAILQNAIANGHDDVAAVLRKAGARGMDDPADAVAMQDRLKITGLPGPAQSSQVDQAYVLAMQDPAKIKELRRTSVRGTTDLVVAVTMQDRAKIKELLASAPSYRQNPAFWTGTLPTAARLGDTDTVRAVLDKGVPPKTDQADAFAEAAGEGQDEALALLLAARQPNDDPAQLHQAIWEAAWNSRPYQPQRSAAHFERCLQLLLDIGAPINQDGGKFMYAAAFTRHPGGNARVMEMLTRAGYDPNPIVTLEGRAPSHLLDLAREASTRGWCSAPVVETLAKLNGLTTLASSSGSVLRPAGSTFAGSINAR